MRDVEKLSSDAQLPANDAVSSEKSMQAFAGDQTMGAKGPKETRGLALRSGVSEALEALRKSYDPSARAGAVDAEEGATMAEVLDRLGEFFEVLVEQCVLCGKEGWDAEEVSAAVRCSVAALPERVQRNIAGAILAKQVEMGVVVAHGAEVKASPSTQATPKPAVAADEETAVNALGARIALTAGMDYHLVVRRGDTDAMPVNPLGIALGSNTTAAESVDPRQLGLCLRCTPTEAELAKRDCRVYKVGDCPDHPGCQ